MALLELLNNDPKFFYYSGQGNFNQKSIPYGNDRPGGGDSQQPFVKFPLPENASSATLNYYEINRLGNDYPLRGGNGTNISLTGPTTPEAARIDRTRIERFLKTSRGNIFLAKQADLQFANPKMEVGESAVPFNQQVGTVAQGGIEFTRVFNQGRNLLKQIEVAGSGFHYDRPGLVPVNPFQAKYEYVVKNKSRELNRLVFLLRSKIEDNQDIFPSGFFNLGISLDRNILLEYPGGPDSAGGLGFTTIPRTVYTDQSDVNPGRGNVNEGVYTLSYNQLSDSLSQVDKGQGKIKEDFRAKFLGNIASSDYINNSIESKYLTGNPGNKNISRINYSKASIEGQDEVNIKLPIITSGDPWNNENESVPDLIKFGFEAINYNDVSTSVFIQFRAFLDSFSDSHQANYNSVKYIGRGETFYAYDGFTRQISFGFLIAAQTRQELIPLYDKLNILTSQIYPDYGANSFMRSPVVKMTIGDYIYRQPGFLNNINLSIESNYPWEIQLDKLGRDRDVAQLPQVIKADCQFTPLHDFLPRKSASTDQITGLINSQRYKNDPSLLPNLPTFNTENINTTLNTQFAPVQNTNRITDTTNTQVGQFGTRLGTSRI